MTELNPATAPAEPLIGVGLWMSVATAVVALLVSFSIPLTDTQQAAVLAAAAAVVPMITALMGRSRVFSPKSVARLVTAARIGPGSL